MHSAVQLLKLTIQGDTIQLLHLTPIYLYPTTTVHHWTSQLPYATSCYLASPHNYFTLRRITKHHFTPPYKYKTQLHDNAHYLAATKLRQTIPNNYFTLPYNYIAEPSSTFHCLTTTRLSNMALDPTKQLLYDIRHNRTTQLQNIMEQVIALLYNYHTTLDFTLQLPYYTIFYQAIPYNYYTLTHLTLQLLHYILQVGTLQLHYSTFRDRSQPCNTTTTLYRLVLCNYSTLLDRS